MKPHYFYLLIFLILGSFYSLFAHLEPNHQHTKLIGSLQQANLRADCAPGVAQTNLAINNVRARLSTGGDLWWDGSNAGYIVPRIDPDSGLREVSSINAAAIWMGGFDPGGNLKVAAQTYGHFNGRDDYWPGPLTDQGRTDPDTCRNWDRFFMVSGKNIREHQEKWRAAQAEGRNQLNPEEIPTDILGWPGLGNEFFFDIHGFSLPNGNSGFNGLGGFWDEGGTPGKYEPQFGDFPILNLRGCQAYSQIIPDEMIFWVYNDAGGVHTSSNGDPLQMEVQATSFAFQTYDQINDMTFYAYRLINRAIEDIDSCHFGLWVDGDLGCYTDDYVGCDPERNLSYIYNADALDGESNCDDCGLGDVATYCTDIPVVGIDFLRGPLNEFGEELGMSSFTYYDSGFYVDLPSMEAPTEPKEFYNYLSGSWRDGTRFSVGGTGYNPIGAFTNYAFPAPPNDPTGWSMCSEGLGIGDRHTIQSAGPFTLKPGAINELLFGVVWVPGIDYPCPDMTRFFQADDKAQKLFDQCFTDNFGFYAPDADWIELDQEVVVVLSNDNPASSNFQESYFELDPRAPGSDSQYFYRFEGYKIFQLRDANGPDDLYKVDLTDSDQARLVAQTDLKNGIKTIYNWFPVENPNKGMPGEPQAIFAPVEMVGGADEGLRHTFSITEDQFANGDRRLINHRDYYYTVIAYAHNEWQPFTQVNKRPEGQDRPYQESTSNVQQYKVTPRPIVDVRLNSQYGQGPIITRLDGQGVGGNFLEISEASHQAIFEENNEGQIEYLPGQGPLDIQIFHPLKIQNRRFKLYLKDSNLADGILREDAFWELENLETGELVASDRSIQTLNEQILPEYGFSISIAQTPDAGDLQAGNGVIGIELKYQDSLGRKWFAGIPDGAPPYDWMKTGPGEINNPKDPAADFNKNWSPTYWQPYTLGDFYAREGNDFMISPVWEHVRTPATQAASPLQALNNVDIVFTADKSKWSRCVVVETASEPYYHPFKGLGIPTEGDAVMFQLRQAPSVGKYDSDGDGLADPDGSGRLGLGWFPGYAIDVETGERLNIFFGENSTYDCTALQAVGLTEECDRIPTSGGGKGIGRDLMWNPGSEIFTDIQIGSTPQNVYPFISGGQHFIYVTKQKYDGCESYYQALLNGAPFDMVTPISQITWTCMPITNSPLLPLGAGETGLIPNDLIFKLRVDNPYEIAWGSGENQGNPAYKISFDNVAVEPLASQEEIDRQLNQIRVVPNPYYGYSFYENSPHSTTVKLTNLPAKCQVTIYSLNGQSVRHFYRNENPAGNTFSGQINPALEWDLKNHDGVAVPGGTYLIQVDAEGLGSRVLKFFAIQRQVDPSKL